MSFFVVFFVIVLELKLGPPSRLLRSTVGSGVTTLLSVSSPGVGGSSFVVALKLLFAVASIASEV